MSHPRHFQPISGSGTVKMITCRRSSRKTGGRRKKQVNANDLLAEAGAGCPPACQESMGLPRATEGRKLPGRNDLGTAQLIPRPFRFNDRPDFRQPGPRKRRAMPNTPRAPEIARQRATSKAKPFRYSVSGMEEITGWSGDCVKMETRRSTRRASNAAERLTSRNNCAGT